MCCLGFVVGGVWCIGFGMRLPFVGFLICGLLVGCALPDTPLWNERQTAGSVRMPMEAATKVVVRGSVISVFRNPVTTTFKGIGMFKNRVEIAAEKLVLLDSVDDEYREAKGIEDFLDRMEMPERVPGKIDYLIDGKAFFGSLEKAVRGAKVSVDSRVFIYDNDDVAVRFSDLLKEKSKTVKCRVLMDELGSITGWWTQPDSALPKGFVAPASMPHYLREGSRVDVRESRNPWLVTDHTKVFVIDGEIGFLGGMNIGREYRYDWHDMMVKVEGPVVTVLQNDFNRAWRLQGGIGDFGMPFLRKAKFRKSLRAGEFGMRVLKTAPGKREIEDSMLAAIRMARKRVYCQNSYFTSDALVAELVRAKERGVDVRMVFPEDNDSKLLDVGNQGVAKTLIDAGARVYMYPQFTHVKAMVVDDWACVGSANYDGLSMRINEELNVAFTDKEAVGRLVSELFLKDFRRSKRLRKMDTTGWMGAVLEPVIDQL